MNDMQKGTADYATRKCTMPTGRSRNAMRYSNRVIGAKPKMIGGVQ